LSAAENLIKGVDIFREAVIRILYNSVWRYEEENEFDGSGFDYEAFIVFNNPPSRPNSRSYEKPHCRFEFFPRIQGRPQEAFVSRLRLRFLMGYASNLYNAIVWQGLGKGRPWVKNQTWKEIEEMFDRMPGGGCFIPQSERLNFILYTALIFLTHLYYLNFGNESDLVERTAVGYWRVNQAKLNQILCGRRLHKPVLI